jgi:NADH-quinone oxidoreductase subunit L
MHGDPRYTRFFTVLQIFSAAMLGLVLSDNLLTLYVCWELMGLSSYLLIGHYFEKKSAADASLKAFMTTRVGDVLMFVGIMIIYAWVGSLRYADIFAAVAQGTFTGPWLTAAGLLLFGGAAGKSAQFPLHVWLPDAMEGPTPVSALIHAATMVAAGVFLMARSYPMLTAEVFITMAYVGGFTAVFAATMGLVMDDIKKVLAYSTVSQLGLMMLGLGVGGFVVTGYTAGIYHLTTHAFFKACLFLGSGSVIHAVHTQSVSEMGGLRRRMPVTFATFLVATLALTGMPPFSGYFTKDSIIASALQMGMEHPRHLLLPAFAIGATVMTAFYMFRLVFLTFLGTPRDAHRHEHAHESPWVMVLPLVILAALSVYPVGGGHGNWFWSRNPVPLRAEGLERYGAAPAAHADRHSPAHAALTTMAAPEHGTHHADVAANRAHHIAVIASLSCFAIGIALAWAMYLRRLLSPEAMARRFAPVHRLLVAKYFMDEFYYAAVVRPLLALCALVAAIDRLLVDGAVNLAGLVTRAFAWLTGLFDRTVVDGTVNAAADSAQNLGRLLGKLQTGRVGNYLVFVLAGTAFLAGFMFWMAAK